MSVGWEGDGELASDRKPMGSRGDAGGIRWEEKKACGFNRGLLRSAILNGASRGIISNDFCISLINKFKDASI